jgi:hypothetical protein
MQESQGPASAVLNAHALLELPVLIQIAFAAHFLDVLAVEDLDIPTGIANHPRLLELVGH